MSVIIAATAVACSSSPVTTGSGHKAPMAHLDGATMFRAVYFGQGNLAAMFPEIWDRPEFRQAHALTPGQQASINELTQALENAHPGFFNRFATEVQSGDHLRVQTALVTGASDIASLVTGTDLGGSRTECLSFFIFGTFIAIASYITAVLGAVYFVALTAQAAVNQTQFVNTSGAAPPGMPGPMPSPSPVLGGGSLSCPPGYSLDSNNQCAPQTNVSAPSSPGNAFVGAPAPIPRTDAGSGIDLNFRLLLEEYVDLIAQRLATTGQPAE